MAMPELHPWPHWFHRAISDGLSAMVVLQLPGHPPAETIGLTRDAWAASLFAGLNVAAAVSGVLWQETVRAHVATLYPHLIDVTIEIRDGLIPLSNRPGLGARWLEELFEPEHPGYRRTQLSDK
jgi:hypothetical protein